MFLTTWAVDQSSPLARGHMVHIVWGGVPQRSASGSGLWMGCGRGPPLVSQPALGQAGLGRYMCHGSRLWPTSAAPAPTSSFEIAKMKEGRCATAIYQIRENIFCFLLFDPEHFHVSESYPIYCMRVWLRSLKKFCANSGFQIRGQRFGWIFRSSDLCR